MCGISGIINNQAIIPQNDFLRISQIVHNSRGPDYFNYWSDENHIITHSRLKIIDLTEQANQPMTSSSEESIIVFNGEIYNFKTIAKELGLNFKTTSDTEVILEAIEHWGIDKTLQTINGMFAFCYINRNSGEIFLARDRFGQKPLYYYSENNTLVFSSDIRVISKSLNGKLSLNYNTIDYYLSELSSPQPATIWNEVSQLEPAHYIQIQTETPGFKKRKYWQLDTTINQSFSEGEILTKVEDKLSESILKRTASDVPLGCFLSGGVDSGLIVSLLAQQNISPIKTFTVGFNYDDFNELDDARLIAKRYQTDHTELKIDVNIEQDIEAILSQFGEPFADSSAIPTYYISKEIRKHVTVALSGDGGDELFGGYTDYGQAYEAELLKNKYPNKLSRQLVGFASKFTSRLSKSYRNYGSAVDYLAKNDPLKLYRNMGFLPNEQTYFIKNRSFCQTHFNHIWEMHSKDSLTTQLTQSSLQTRLLNDYLVKVDRASMANSLEVRSPFMDHELAEFAFSIPHTIKFKDFQLKYILKRLGQKHMYQDIFNRPKRGFSVPIKHWLKHELFDFSYTHIDNLIARKDFVNKSALQLLEQHKKGIFDHTHKIWALVCLEIWLKQNID